MPLLPLRPIVFPVPPQTHTFPTPYIRLYTDTPTPRHTFPASFLKPASEYGQCFGPVGGSPPYIIESSDKENRTMAVYWDELCTDTEEMTINDCLDCWWLWTNWDVGEK
ncbi:MAG: hypothetical protein Q9176_005480, partial [Flavoplaca citrina]